MRHIGNGRYALVRELGRGGMGVVWLANDTMLGRDVAIKELLLPAGIPAAETTVYQERVMREARIASRLANAAVVTVHDLVKEDGQTFIVMEYVQAPTLSELVERDGPMPTVRAARLAEQLLSALESAHDAGIVHRDVKPGNVMVPARDSAKLTDFGIAQTFDDPRLTSTGALIGSPAYMSPERLEGGDVMPAWDLWALGATLFFAVEGRSAYQRGTTSATMLAVMQERAHPERAQGPLAEVIVGFMEPNPEVRMRPDRAWVLIEQALGQRPAEEPPTVRTGPVPQPPIPYSPPPPQVKRKMPLYVAVIGAVSTVALLAFSAVVLSNAFSDDTPANANTPTAASTPKVGASMSGVSSGSPSAPHTSGSATPVSSKAMVPVMVYGAGGDMDDMAEPFINGDCLKWTPKKGGKAPDFADTGCYGSHETEMLTQDWADRELEKDKPYPGRDALARQWADHCTRLFQSNVVVTPNKENVLRFWVLVPSEDSWKLKTKDGYRMSHRLVYCLIGNANGNPLTDKQMADS
jgi:serine/threonine protein kinase